MSRMQMTQLTNLIDGTEAGGYTLPDDITNAVRTHARVKALELAAPATLDFDTAAARVVSAAASGEAVDVLALGREIHDVERGRLAHDAATRLLGEAIEQAANLAVNTAADLTEAVIAHHLRPALEDVHEKAREAAAGLDGYGLDTHALLTAPAKARNAYMTLSGLVARRDLILTARRWANTIGLRQPQHDGEYLFASFRDPLALVPGWKPGARIPQLPVPEDPSARLLWIVGDGAVAKPWLPTMAEQDAAWWDRFGEAQQMRAQAHRDALAIGARC